MATMTLSDIAKKLKKIDFCMLATKADTGAISHRPMSNNGDVEYDGDSWFFSHDDTNKVADIRRDPRVTLSFTEPPSLLGKPGIFLSIEAARQSFATEDGSRSIGWMGWSAGLRKALTRPASCSSRCTLTAFNIGTARRTAWSKYNSDLLAHRRPQTSAPPGGRWHAACA
jgi:hypothetical protein